MIAPRRTHDNECCVFALARPLAIAGVPHFLCARCAPGCKIRPLHSTNVAARM